MKRFTNILFVDVTNSDDMPAALHHAARLAGANGAKLTLHSIVPEAPALQRDQRLEPNGPTIQEMVRDHHAARLERFGTALSSPDLTVEVDVGSPPLEIVQRVIGHHHDLVLITADPTEESSATVRRVLRLCPCPVWVLRPHTATKRVLAAIDPADEPDLNRLILELAQSQTARIGGELHIVHAWEPYGYRALNSDDSPAATPSALATYVDAAETAHRKAFEATIADAGAPPEAHRHLVDGPPQQAIIGLIHLYLIDLLVMGAVGRKGNNRTLVGNTAEQLFNSIESSVLVVKPAGFVSPVTAA